MPVSAKEKVPQWYKDSETGLNLFDEKTGKELIGLKKCVPFLDALVSGYLLLTSVDIYITKKPDGFLDISYSDDLQGKYPIDIRPDESGKLIPRPPGHRREHLVWTGNWGWKTPRGYSSLICHPFNRFDLPFTTMAGIIDSDKMYGSGNLPFFLKGDFEGVIKKGTPYAQILPFKRKKWYSAFAPKMEEQMQMNSKKNADGRYKKISWVRKEY